MIYTVKEQAILMLYSVILGAGIAIIYDMFCFYTEKMKKYIRYIIEIFLWVLLTFIASRYMLVNSKGYLPIYTFGFYIIGLILYYLFLSKDFKWRFKKFNEIIFKLYKKIRGTIFIIIIPKEFIIYLYYKIKRIFKKLKTIKKKKKQEEDDPNDKLEISSPLEEK